MKNEKTVVEGSTAGDTDNKTLKVDSHIVISVEERREGLCLEVRCSLFFHISF